MIDLLFDMETQDPDDVFALCLLAAHPRVALRGVTINPGSTMQVGVVRRVLEKVGRDDVPVGSRNPKTEKEQVSEFHFTWLGAPKPTEPDALAHELLASQLVKYPEAVLLTGAPLHNLRLLLNEHPEARIKRWVGQGGFAGDSVVPEEHRLPKFVGRETCPTFNFNGDPKAARMMLESERIEQRDLVSKNVCHGVVYDQTFHAKVEPYRDRTPGLAAIYEGMTIYLEGRSSGKAFHDPLAACAAIRREILQFSEVYVYRAKGEWGSTLAPGTNTFISIALDRQAYFETFVGLS